MAEVIERHCPVELAHPTGDPLSAIPEAHQPQTVHTRLCQILGALVVGVQPAVVGTRVGLSAASIVVTDG